MKINKKLWKHLPYCGNILCIFKNTEEIIGCGKMQYTFSKEKIGELAELCNVSAKGFKSACVTISFVMPLGEKASLYALVPNVLTRSSKEYPDITSIERTLASLYGAEIGVDISKTGEHQVIKLSISCIDDRFAFDGESITANCSELLFQLVFNPNVCDGGFSLNDVESEKRLLTERLLAEESDKRAYAKNRCEEEMFKNEAYGIHRYGTKEDIAEITPESLYEAYLEILEKSKIAVCVSGNGNIDLVKEKLAKYLGNVKRNPQLSETLFVENAEDVSYACETENVKQGKLVMGFRLGMKNADDNYAARRVMADIFGGSPHSKLFTIVREKMSLCYYCSARMIRAKGIMLVQSGIETENEEKAKEAILAQLEDIKNGNFADSDIEATKKALEDGFKSVSDSPESLDAWFMSQCVSGVYKYPEEFIDAFNGVTREDIINAAKDVTLDTVFMLKGTGGADCE